MRRLVAAEGLTLDGVMQGPGAPDEDRSGGFEYGGWQMPYFDEVAAAEIGKTIGETGAFLLGRVTYEIMAAYWPNQPSGEMFADVLNGLPKHVASTTLEEPLSWDKSSLLKGDVPEAVRALKEEDGGDIVILGSGRLVRSLIPHGLIDGLSLMIHPLLLGPGKRLFDGLEGKIPWRLTKATTTSTGVILADYQLDQD